MGRLLKRSGQRANQRKISLTSHRSEQYFARPVRSLRPSEHSGKPAPPEITCILYKVEGSTTSEQIWTSDQPSILLSNSDILLTSRAPASMQCFLESLEVGLEPIADTSVGPSTRQPSPFAISISDAFTKMYIDISILALLGRSVSQFQPLFTPQHKRRI